MAVGPLLAFVSHQQSRGNGSRLTLTPLAADKMGVRVTFNSVYPPYAMKGGHRPIDDLVEIGEPRFTGTGLDQTWRMLRVRRAQSPPALTPSPRVQEERKGCELVYPYEQKMQSWVSGRVVLIG